MSASKKKPPPMPLTESFYREAGEAGFTREQVEFLEKWFALEREHPWVEEMEAEHGAQYDYEVAG